MKKLYRRGTVHPSPPIVSDHLSFLPATILALAAALSLEDREVLAYLISYSNSNNNSSVNLSSSSPSYGPRKTTTASSSSSSRKSTAAKSGSGSGSGGDHPARFNCNCFRCYTSYWVRWDESPNRELIHEIIDAFEDGLLAQSGGGGGGGGGSSKAAGSKYSKKDRRNNNKRGNNGNGSGQGSDLSLKKKDQLVKPHMVEETTDSGDVDDGEENKGSVRRFVSFLGERIWGTVWSQ